MDLVLMFLGLRYLAELLKAGRTEAAGERLGRDLDHVATEAGSCLRVSCGCYMLLCLGWLLFATIDWLVGLVTSR